MISRNGTLNVSLLFLTWNDAHDGFWKHRLISSESGVINGIDSFLILFFSLLVFGSVMLVLWEGSLVL
jgi:hypothetical protein